MDSGGDEDLNLDGEGNEDLDCDEDLWLKKWRDMLMLMDEKWIGYGGLLWKSIFDSFCCRDVVKFVNPLLTVWAAMVFAHILFVIKC